MGPTRRAGRELARVAAQASCRRGRAREGDLERGEGAARRRCRQTKPAGEFGSDRSKPSGRRSCCRACDQAQAARYYGAHRGLSFSASSIPYAVTSAVAAESASLRQPPWLGLPAQTSSCRRAQQAIGDEVRAGGYAGNVTSTGQELPTAKTGIYTMPTRQARLIDLVERGRASAPAGRSRSLQAEAEVAPPAAQRASRARAAGLGQPDLQLSRRDSGPREP